MLRNWSFGAAARYDKAASQGTVLGDYSDVGESLLLSRLLGRQVSFILTYSARQYTSSAFPNYNRTIHEGRMGFGYSPGEIPLRIW